MSKVKSEKVGPEAPIRSASACLVELSQLLEAVGLNKTQAAGIIGVDRGTLGRWFSSRRSPEFRSVENAIRRVVEHPLTRAKAGELHHLYYEKSRGWLFRYTLEVNRRMVGQRMKARLRTHDLREAIERRKILVDQFEKLGFKVSDRRQRRRDACG